MTTQNPREEHLVRGQQFGSDDGIIEVCFGNGSTVKISLSDCLGVGDSVGSSSSMTAKRRVTRSEVDEHISSDDVPTESNPTDSKQPGVSDPLEDEVEIVQEFDEDELRHGKTHMSERNKETGHDLYDRGRKTGCPTELEAQLTGGKKRKLNSKKDKREEQAKRVNLNDKRFSLPTSLQRLTSELGMNLWSSSSSKNRVTVDNESMEFKERKQKGPTGQQVITADLSLDIRNELSVARLRSKQHDAKKASSKLSSSKVVADTTNVSDKVQEGVSTMEVSAKKKQIRSAGGERSPSSQISGASSELLDTNTATCIPHRSLAMSPAKKCDHNKPGAEGIAKPHSHDILLGRGADCNNHIGNKIYRTVVEHNKPSYRETTRHAKWAYAVSIVDAIEKCSPPGRFLERKKVDQSTLWYEPSMLWYEVTREKAIEKTAQALREKTHNTKLSIEEIPSEFHHLIGENSAIFTATRVAAALAATETPPTELKKHISSSSKQARDDKVEEQAKRVKQIDKQKDCTNASSEHQSRAMHYDSFQSPVSAVSEFIFDQRMQKWIAQCTVKGVRTHLGFYKSKADAELVEMRFRVVYLPQYVPLVLIKQISELGESFAPLFARARWAAIASVKPDASIGNS